MVPVERATRFSNTCGDCSFSGVLLESHRRLNKHRKWGIYLSPKHLGQRMYYRDKVPEIDPYMVIECERIQQDRDVV